MSGGRGNDGSFGYVDTMYSTGRCTAEKCTVRYQPQASLEVKSTPCLCLCLAVAGRGARNASSSPANHTPPHPSFCCTSHFIHLFASGPSTVHHPHHRPQAGQRGVEDKSRTAVLFLALPGASFATKMRQRMIPCLVPGIYHVKLSSVAMLFFSLLATSTSTRTPSTLPVMSMLMFK